MKDSELREELRFYSEQHYMKPLTEAGFTNYRSISLQIKSQEENEKK